MHRDRFLEGMSRAVATVSVVTTDGPAGRMGATVSAMTSVSADSPSPSLLVCLNDRTATAHAIRTNGVFCVNVLRDDQSYISKAFAGGAKSSREDKFECGRWTTLQSPAPALVDALVTFDCTVKSALLYGTHWIIIGELNDIAVSEAQSALTYANRAYGRSITL